MRPTPDETPPSDDPRPDRPVPADGGDAGPSDDLRALAEAYGVSTDFWDWQGRHVPRSRSTVVAVLAALGVEASGPEDVAAALEEARLAPWRRTLPSCVVTREGRASSCPVRVPAGRAVRAWAELEDGTRRELAVEARDVAPVRVDGVTVAESAVVLPDDLPLGWHRLRVAGDTDAAAGVAGDTDAAVGVAGDTDAAAGVADGALVVTPARLGSAEAGADVADRADDEAVDRAHDRAWGFMTQLYATRSAESWGLGDLADLAETARWSAGLGAGFVLVNPLHAAQPLPPVEPSPYFPTTRRFLNPLYLRVEDVPEVAVLPAEDRARVDALAGALRVRNTTDDLLDRDAVWQAKRAALLLAFAARDGDRQAALDAYVAAEGDSLLTFATWCALAEEQGPHWRSWPAALQDPASPETAAAAERLAGTVAFHCWLQMLCDEQTAAAQDAARGAGMPLGVLHDLAVGVDPDGADAWALPGVLARGVTAGAPPDGFNQQGQDWRQPPWHPGRLAEAEYAPFREMVARVLRHAGGVRVDHVLGLFRLWWVPEGASAADGTYVRYDHEALVGILCLEAHRRGAVVVGEDLGTVEPSTREYLAERGVAGTSILWWERDDGQPRPPGRWRRNCLATVTTHDLPPTAGYLAGEHVDIRAGLGLLTRPVEEERAADEAERREWLDALRAEGLLGDDPTEEETVVALHAYLARTPCRLVGVALPDVVGDRRPQNQPGTVDAYPNWRLPTADGEGRPVLLSDVEADPRAEALARVLTPARHGPLPCGP